MRHVRLFKRRLLNVFVLDVMQWLKMEELATHRMVAALLKGWVCRQVTDAESDTGWQESGRRDGLQNPNDIGAQCRKCFRHDCSFYTNMHECERQYELAFKAGILCVRVCWRVYRLPLEPRVQTASEANLRGRATANKVNLVMRSGNKFAPGGAQICRLERNIHVFAGSESWIERSEMIGE